jgi:hypothetical protein
MGDDLHDYSGDKPTRTAESAASEDAGAAQQDEWLQQTPAATRVSAYL